MSSVHVGSGPSGGSGSPSSSSSAVELARENGLEKVIFVTDCLSLIQRLNSSVMDRSPVGILVGGIKVMATSFTSVSYTHVKRHLNEAAHRLAKSCFSFSSSEVFISVPDCIQGLCVLMLFNQ